MPARGPTVLILVLALAFVSVMLLRTGVVAHRWRDSEPAAVAGASDSSGSLLPRLDSTLVWVGGPPRAINDSAGTLLVLWTLSEPAALSAVVESQQWQDLYAEKGLRVLGVYVPRFSFDADSTVVAREMKRLGVRFPVALDTGLTLLNHLAPGSRLPQWVVAGPDGLVRASESDPRAAERAVERAVVAIHPELANPGVADSAPPPAPAANPIHAPVYLGASAERHGPLADVAPGAPRLFHAAFQREIDGAPWVPYPVGTWSLEADGLRATRGGAQNYLALRYDGGPLAVVASPAAGRTTRLWVLRDDAWLAADALGSDARLDGRGASYVDVGSPRLYALCRDDGHAHTIKLSPDDPGLVLHELVFEPVPLPERPRP